MNEHLHSRSSHAPRPGIVLFTVIAVLAVAMIVIGSMLGQLVREHRQCRLRHADRQCRRLAEAALARAAILRASNPSYSGETWIVSASDLGADRDASVTIQLDGQVISATAQFPAGNEPHVRHTETHFNHRDIEGAEAD